MYRAGDGDIAWRLSADRGATQKTFVVPGVSCHVNVTRNDGPLANDWYWCASQNITCDEGE